MAIFTVGKSIRVRMDTGFGDQVLAVISDQMNGWSDGQWHKVEIQRSQSNTTLTVDDRISDSVICDFKNSNPGIIIINITLR